jgi:hypothetical protein
MGWAEVRDVLKDDRHRRRILVDASLFGALAIAGFWWIGRQDLSITGRVAWSILAAAVLVPGRIYALAHRVRHPPTRSTYVWVAVAWLILIVTWLVLYFVVL